MLMRTDIALTKFSGTVSSASVLVFFALGGFVFACHQLDLDFAINNGLFIPDSLNITQTLENDWVADRFWDVGSNLFGIKLVYGWTWYVHPSISYIVNLFLTSLSILVCRRLAFSVFGMLHWPVLGIILNPYLILVMPGPNKEIPLMLITICLCWQWVYRNRYWLLISSLLCLIAYFLREGYGIFLLFCQLMIFYLKTRYRRFAFILCLMLLMLAIFWSELIPLFSSISPNIQTYVTHSDIGAAPGTFSALLYVSPTNVFLAFPLFLLRLAFNSLTLAMFPIFYTQDGALYWSGISYWIAGICTILIVSASLIQYFSNFSKKSIAYLFCGLVVGTWFFISLSLIVQPRYLMPVIPIGFLALASAPPNLRNGCIAFALIFSISSATLNTSFGHASSANSFELEAAPAYVW